MVHNGMITPDEALDNPQKHVITRYMESVDSDQNRCMATVLNTKDILSGDYILLCTDGVCNQIDDDEISDILFNSEMSDEVKLSTMAQMCKESDDNNTAILIPVANVVADKQEMKSVESSGGTKKFSFSNSTIEEIESTQRQRGTRFFHWIKQIFN
jgi:serine/threonine protein phosphatase PrpC